MVCGSLWWFAVVCGGLWWIAVVCLLVIPGVSNTITNTKKRSKISKIVFTES